MTHSGALFQLETSRAIYRSRRVIVATGPFQLPSIPAYPGRENAALAQLHSSEYQNPSSLTQGPVLVVGAGNSAAQIAEELSLDREVVMSIRKRLMFIPLVAFGKSVFYWGERLGLLYADKKSWPARLMRRRGDPIFGSGLRQRISEGAVRLTPEIAAFDGDLVRFRDGKAQRFSAVVWATGFRSAYPWLQVDGALDESGAPRHTRGLSSTPGLGFVGLAWQRSRSSGLLLGAGRDAASVVDAIATSPARVSFAAPAATMALSQVSASAQTQ